MKNPVYEQIQARKVKARLRMLQHAQHVSGNVSQEGHLKLSKQFFLGNFSAVERRGKPNRRTPSRGTSSCVRVTENVCFKGTVCIS
jgi:hypothetical protein